jgi:hypothetical protein
MISVVGFQGFSSAYLQFTLISNSQSSVACKTVQVRTEISCVVADFLEPIVIFRRIVLIGPQGIHSVVPTLLL